MIYWTILKFKYTFKNISINPLNASSHVSDVSIYDRITVLGICKWTLRYFLFTNMLHWLFSPSYQTVCFLCTPSMRIHLACCFGLWLMLTGTPKVHNWFRGRRRHRHTQCLKNILKCCPDYLKMWSEWLNPQCLECAFTPVLGVVHLSTHHPRCMLM